MKKLLLFFAIAFMSINAMAQYAQNDTPLQEKPINIIGSRVFMDGKRLDKQAAANCFSSLNGIDRSVDYLKYRKYYKTGLGLTFGGLSLAAAGYVTTAVALVVALPKAFAKENTIAEDIAIYTGVGSMIVGGASFLAGVPLACVYRVRLNRLEKAYNGSLQLQASSNGLGLAFCF